MEGQKISGKTEAGPATLSFFFAKHKAEKPGNMTAAPYRQGISLGDSRTLESLPEIE